MSWQRVPLNSPVDGFIVLSNMNGAPMLRITRWVGIPAGVSLQELSRVYDAAIHVRGPVDAEGLEFLGWNTLHDVSVEFSLVVVSRREHRSPGEGQSGFVVTVRPESVQVGEDGVDEVARVLAGDDEVARKSHLPFGEGVDGIPSSVLLSAVANSHLPRTELLGAGVTYSCTQHSHVGRQLQQSHLSPDWRLVKAGADDLSSCAFPNNWKDLPEVTPHDDDLPTPWEVVAHDIPEAALDGFMTEPVGHGRLVPKYGIGHTQQLGPRALLFHEAGGVGRGVYGDHEEGVGGASAR